MSYDVPWGVNNNIDIYKKTKLTKKQWKKLAKIAGWEVTKRQKASK